MTQLGAPSDQVVYALARVLCHMHLPQPVHEYPEPWCGVLAALVAADRPKRHDLLQKWLLARGYALTDCYELDREIAAQNPSAPYEWQRGRDAREGNADE